MPIPVVVIVGQALRAFFQWAIKHLVQKFGKKIAEKVFREAMAFLIKRYGSKVIEKLKIERDGDKISVLEWIEKAPLKELRDYFSRYGVEIGDNLSTPIVQNTKSPTQLRNDYTIKYNQYSPDASKIRRWYTIKGYKMNPLPKTEL